MKKLARNFVSEFVSVRADFLISILKTLRIPLGCRFVPDKFKFLQTILTITGNRRKNFIEKYMWKQEYWSVQVIKS